MHFTSNYWEHILQSVISTLQNMILGGYLYDIQLDELGKMIAAEELDYTWIKTSPEDPAQFVLRFYPLQSDSEASLDPQSGTHMPGPTSEKGPNNDSDDDDPIPPGIRPSPAVADLRLVIAGLNLNTEAQDEKKEAGSERKKE